MDRWHLEDQEVEEFRNALAEEHGIGPAGGIKEVWGTFKMALGKAQSSLLHVSKREESDWMTEEMHEVSRKKQEASMRLVKTPG